MFRHTCVLPNHQFYFYILAVSSALLCIYILCNLYNLVSQKTNMAQNISWLSNLLLYNISEETRQIDLTSFNSDNFAGVDNMASDGSNVSHHTQVQVSECDPSGLYVKQSHLEIGENYDWCGLMHISAAMPWVFHIREHVYKPKTIKVAIRTTTTMITTTAAAAATITMTITWAFYSREHVYKPKKREIITTTAATTTMTITWAIHIREHVDQPSYSSEKNVISTDNFLTVYFDRCEYSDLWHLFTKILLLNNTRL